MTYFLPTFKFTTNKKGGPSQMKVVTSACCQAMIKAKITDGKIEYLYCSKCKNKVDEKNLINPDNEQK